jgi:hypothetical protein
MQVSIDVRCVTCDDAGYVKGDEHAVPTASLRDAGWDNVHEGWWCPACLVDAQKRASGLAPRYVIENKFTGMLWCSKSPCGPAGFHHDPAFGSNQARPRPRTFSRRAAAVKYIRHDRITPVRGKVVEYGWHTTKVYRD